MKNSGQRDHDASDPCPEVDIWWGGYAARTVFPLLAVGLVLTGLIGWLTLLAVPADMAKLIFLGVGGAVWLTLGVRWAYRFFAYNYRLTTSRLFVNRGLLYGRRGVEVELAKVSQVRVRRGGMERLLRLGRVVLHLDDKSQPPVVLDALSEPFHVAELIRDTCRRAREQQVPEVRV